MALSLEQIKLKFSHYSGEDMEDAGPRGQLCAQLCQDCLGRAESLLGRADLTEAEAAAVESWAAAEAFYQLALADEATGMESVSADGVKLEAGERSRKAKALAGEKRREAAGLLGEEGFYFGLA